MQKKKRSKQKKGLPVMKEVKETVPPAHVMVIKFAKTENGQGV